MINGYFRRMVEELGIRNAWSLGEGGIGYLRNGNNSGKYARQKIGDLVAVAPDAITIALGINDNPSTASAIAAEAALYVGEVLATYPNALVFVFGPFRGLNTSAGGSNYGIDITKSNALKAAVQGLPGYGKRFVYLDTIANNWQDDTDPDIYEPDKIHPSFDGAFDLGANKAAPAILAHCQALVA